MKTCKKCGTLLNQEGRCQDETCLFSDNPQEGVATYNKVTVGFVIQRFEDGKCISQEFVAGEATYENALGETISEPENESYHPFEMVQPVKE